MKGYVAAMGGAALGARRRRLGAAIDADAAGSLAELRPCVIGMETGPASIIGRGRS